MSQTKPLPKRPTPSCGLKWRVFSAGFPRGDTRPARIIRRFDPPFRMANYREEVGVICGLICSIFQVAGPSRQPKSQSRGQSRRPKSPAKVSGQSLRPKSQSRGQSRRPNSLAKVSCQSLRPKSPAKVAGRSRRPKSPAEVAGQSSKGFCRSCRQNRSLRPTAPHRSFAEVDRSKVKKRGE